MTDSGSAGPLLVTLGLGVVVLGLLVWSGALAWFGRLAYRPRDAESRTSGLFSYRTGMDTTGSYSGASARRRPTTRT